MSRELISRSPDLKRLQDEGYEVDVVAGFLLVRHVPYVSAQREVKYGVLVSTLTLAGERTTRPDTHVVQFAGDQPCHRDGSEIQQLKHQQERKKLANGVEVDRSFSNKPADGYSDYHHKMTTYVKVISGPALSLDPAATARTHVVDLTEDDAVFHYTDTATTRAEIGAVTQRLEGHRVGIVGLGGTGAYVLDLVAKTPVAEIHLFDRDHFHQHNAFRAPGAPSREELADCPRKVDHFATIYSRMHKGIKPHAVFLARDNADELAKLDFIFVCVDSGQARKELIELLNRYEKAFIDVGMGLSVLEECSSLIGMLRVSTSTPSDRAGESEMPVAEDAPDDVYSTNIQLADLNSLNASLAVIRWKKLYGFYQDLEGENFTAYAINVNQLVSERKRRSE